MMQSENTTFVHRTDLVDLASFDGTRALEPCCLYLSEQGIETEVFDEGGLQSVVFFTKPKANVKIQVKEEDYAAAVEKLIEFEKLQPQLGSFIYSCPECGSFAVEYPQFSRKFMSPLLFEWLSNFGLFEKLCYCRKCHATWPRTRHPEINPMHLQQHPDMFVPPPA